MAVDPQFPNPAPHALPDPWPDEEIHQSIPARFAKQVACRPQHPAVVSERFQWSYQELDDRAESCANMLRSLHTNPSSTVALLMAHDAPLMAAMLGVLKAGSVCVVLSPAHPEARLSSLLGDATATTIITDRQNDALAKSIGGDSSLVVNFDDIPSVNPSRNPLQASFPESPAFIVYTSGTMGKARGVVQLHQNILHNVRRHTLGMKLSHEDKICLLSYCGAGQGMATTFCALLNGATLFPRDIALTGLNDMADWLDHHSISVFVASASIFRNFTAALVGQRTLSKIRMVRLASEPVYFSDYLSFTKHFSPECVFANTYSSTETGNICQYYLPNHWSNSGEDIMPIGKPALGVEVLLWDEYDQAVPDGEVGEIIVKSKYNSPGYWNNPEQTTDSFFFLPGSDATCYRTRDLARKLPDGNFVHLGRADDQIKIRGFRVNPGEIVEQLIRHPLVKDAVVDTRSDQAGSTRLVAYLHVHANTRLDSPELRTYLRAMLPEYMVPSNYIQLDDFPRTPNGKVDRTALFLLPISSEPPCDSPAEPASELQSLVSEIFCALLNREFFGIHQSFFEAGGDSLLVTQLLCRIESSTGIAIPIADFFARPTIAGVESAIRQRQESGNLLPSHPIVPANRDLPLPLSFSQLRTWNFSQNPEISLGYLVCSAFNILGPLEPGVFQSCIDEIVRRHESLRTTFPLVNDHPRQCIHPPSTGTCLFCDFSSSDNAEDLFDAHWRKEKSQPINLASGPIFRSGLVRVSATRHYFYMCVHHIVWDSWSRGNFFDELGGLYAAFIAGRPSPLPENTLQYADFAAWQKQHIHPQSPLFQHQLAYWKQNLAGATRSMALPFLKDEASPVPPSADCTLRWEFTREESQFIDQTKRGAGATFFMTQLALLARALNHLTGIEDVVIGSYLTNRNRPETLGMLGFFSNLVTFRLNLSGNPDFRELVDRVKTSTLEASNFGDIPYEELCAALRKEKCKPPEIQIILGIGHRDRTTKSANLEWAQLKRRDESMPWGIQFGVNFGKDNLSGYLRFDGKLYAPDKMQALVSAYRSLLRHEGQD